MEKRIFEVTEQYLVEVFKSKPLGNSGTWTDKYQWEVCIATNGSERRGKAFEPKDQKRKVDWMPIEEGDNALDVMVAAIEYQVNR